METAEEEAERKMSAVVEEASFEGTTSGDEPLEKGADKSKEVESSDADSVIGSPKQTASAVTEKQGVVPDASQLDQIHSDTLSSVAPAPSAPSAPRRATHAVSS